MRGVLKKLINRKLKNSLGVIFQETRYFSSNAPGILNSGLPDIEIPKVSINEYVWENIGKWENHTATECGVTGRKYSYKQLITKSKNLGAFLRKKFNLQKGDKVAILLPNIPEFPIVALGALNAGLICTTINPLYTPDEISRQLLDCSAKAIITLTDFWPLAKEAKTLTEKELPIVTINSQPNQTTPSGAVNFTELTDNQIDHEHVPVSSDDVAFIPYSSGTTGLPKGVQLTHSNIIANLCQLEHPLIGENRATTPEKQDVITAILPMFHIYGLTVQCCYHTRLGCKVVTLPKFTPELYIGSLRKHKPDVLYVAPPIAIFLANHPEVKKEDFDCLRSIINGAASLGTLDCSKLMQKAGRKLPILQGYGLTETSPAVLSVRLPHLDNPKGVGSLGTPVPNTLVKVIAIDDPKGIPLGPNETGELLIKGPQVMKGYYNKSEENENIFMDGWMRTGDMMYYNDEGFLFITDRLKELIKVKGFQVAPAELEEILRNFPTVAEAAVVGIPHDSLGEVPRAYIVPKQGVQVNVDELAEHVNKKVAAFKQLKGGVSIIDSIPKNATGKILRKALKQKFEKEGV